MAKVTEISLVRASSRKISLAVHAQKPNLTRGARGHVGDAQLHVHLGISYRDSAPVRVTINPSLIATHFSYLYRFGYNDVVTIPAGATNIDIKQHSRRGVRHDGNYLALRTLDGKYLLNGNFTVSAMEQDIFVKGTVLRYSGSLTTLERLQSYQQLPESVVVQVLTVSSEMFLPKAFPPPKVKYTFFIPKDLQFSKQKIKEKSLANMIKPLLTSQWVLGDWSECSKSCSSGWQRRTVECLDVEGQPSSTCDKVLKPEDIKPCSGLPCPIWQMGPWSPCSQTCGEGMRTRSALCIDYLGKPVAFEKCNSSQPPAATIVCVLQDC